MTIHNWRSRKTLPMCCILISSKISKTWCKRYLMKTYCLYFSTTERNCKKPLLFSLAKEGERTFCLHLSKLDIHNGVKFIFWGAFFVCCPLRGNQIFWRDFRARFITAVGDHKPNANYSLKVSSLFKLQLFKTVNNQIRIWSLIDVTKRAILDWQPQIC